MHLISRKNFVFLFFSGATNRDNLVHPTRAIQFLVGTRGKNETLAIGGPWSPSLDGLHPESDPSVLVFSKFLHIDFTKK